MSFPLVRIRLTKQDRPSAASQAPNLRRMRIDEISEGLFFKDIRGMARHIERIIASSARRDISRCFRWIVMVKRATILATGSRQIIGVNIAKGEGEPVFGLQDRCF